MLERVLASIILAGGLATLSACSGIPTLDRDAEAIDFTKGSVVLVSVTTKNDHKPEYVPLVDSLTLESNAAPSSGAAPSSSSKSASVGSQPAAAPEKEKRQGWYAIQLPPGTHVLREISGHGGDGFLIQGHFEFPINASFDLHPDEILCLGRIEMINRKRVGDEPASGGIFPLIDQAVTGFHDSTFDVQISPPSEAETTAFKQNFKVLRDREIHTGELVLVPPKPRPPPSPMAE